ncbi:HAMP domain-containing histidine kinase [Paenibacillus pasadenensis]|uniref:sensor histidine kinase n=1 Tax=Paenibacillus pasadenensis TaxID=217090 RepID=UPI00203C24CA|nr:HAMP domain-containing sensor histidine kinase [Paenibacillus pasadenensis]MCM3749526.1 HAMP domain-containing histidine kinase [Paenibacillus pasadenensis]
MKLQLQFNLAFGLLLVFVLGFAAVLIHFVLLDYLVANQKQELRKINTEMAAKLGAAVGGQKAAVPSSDRGDSSNPEQAPQDQTASPDGTKAVSKTEAAQSLFEEYSGLALLLDEDGNVVQSSNEVRSLPSEALKLGKEDSTQFTTISPNQGNYISDVLEVPGIGRLAQLTPLSQIKQFERALMGRLLLVLLAGGLLALLLSMLLTRKLIRPLMKLRGELHKVQERRFGEVSLVQAGGEIGNVARTVYDLAGELDRHNRAQKQFFQNASHELKTPLMSIAGYAEGIRDGVFQGEQSIKGLEIIRNEAGRLTRIVTEMTLLAKLESEEDIFQPSGVDVKELIEDTAERVNPLLGSRSIQLNMQWPDQEPKRHLITADRDKLLQAFLNLLSNAIRHAQSTINVEAIYGKDSLTVRIHDDGPGFPEELIPNLFKRFVKGKGGETGLGLAISRAIVERSGGTISAGNDSDGGAVLTVALPLTGALQARGKVPPLALQS